MQDISIPIQPSHSSSSDFDSLTSPPYANALFFHYENTPKAFRLDLSDATHPDVVFQPTLPHSTIPLADNTKPLTFHFFSAEEKKIPPQSSITVDTGIHAVIPSQCSTSFSFWGAAPFNKALPHQTGLSVSLPQTLQTLQSQFLPANKLPHSN